MNVPRKRDSVLDRLREIRVPALVIVGEHDVLLPPSHSNEVAARLTDASLVVVEKAGHLSTEVMRFAWFLGTASSHRSRPANRLRTRVWNRIRWRTPAIFCSSRPGRCERSREARRRVFDHPIYTHHSWFFSSRRECGDARFDRLAGSRIFCGGILARSTWLDHRQRHGHACLLVYRPQGCGRCSHHW